MGAEFQLKQQAKMFSQNVYLPAVYDLHRCCRVERNLIVFADAHHDGRPEGIDVVMYDAITLDQLVDEGWIQPIGPDAVRDPEDIFPSRWRASPREARCTAYRLSSAGNAVNFEQGHNKS